MRPHLKSHPVATQGVEYGEDAHTSNFENNCFRPDLSIDRGKTSVKIKRGLDAPVLALTGYYIDYYML